MFTRIKSIVRTAGIATVSLLILYGMFSVLSNTEHAVGAPTESISLSMPAAPAAQINGSSAAPKLLSYQGTLRDQDGNLLSGEFDILFRIYDDVSAPTSSARWDEQHISVTVRSGHFSVLLGNTQPFPSALFNRADYFIGVTVADFDELPRQRFSSVPYAIQADRARNADLVDGKHANAFASAGHEHARLNASDGSPSNAVSVDSAGEVGVGTTNPQAPLHVNKSGIPQLRLGETSTNYWQLWGGVNLHIRDSNNDDVLFLNRSNRVGINTTSPNATLDVNGDLNVRGTIKNFSTKGPFNLDPRPGGSRDLTRNLASTSDHICFLTNVTFQDLDTSSEFGQCEVTPVGSQWRMRARMGNSDNDIFCSAMCLGW